MIKLVIFDLDNTLTDFMRVKRLSSRRPDAMLDAGLDQRLPRGGPEPVRERVIRRVNEIYEREGIESQKIFNSFLQEELGAVDHKFLAAAIVGYRRARDSALVPYPHVHLTLHELMRRQIRLAVDAPVGCNHCQVGRNVEDHPPAPSGHLAADHLTTQERSGQADGQVWGHGGWVYFFTKAPVLDVAGLRKVKMYTWAGDDAMVQRWKSNGFQPVALAMTDIVLFVLYTLPLAVVLPIYIALRRRRDRVGEARWQEAVASGLTEPASLHSVVNRSICMGSGACVRACPKGALGIIRGKAHLVNPSLCIGHGACAQACPAEAITLVWGTLRRGIDMPC